MSDGQVRITPEAAAEAGYTLKTVEVDIGGQALSSLVFGRFIAEVRRAQPDAHDVLMFGADPVEGEPGKFKVDGAWRAPTAAVEAVDKAMADQRLRTSARATVYVNELVRGFLEQELDGFKTVAHAGETPDDRKDAHLVIEAIQRAVRELSAANVLLMARQAPVVAVTADSRPDVPPPGAPVVPVPGTRAPRGGR